MFLSATDITGMRACLTILCVHGACASARMPTTMPKYSSNREFLMDSVVMRLDLRALTAGWHLRKCWLRPQKDHVQHSDVQRGAPCAVRRGALRPPLRLITRSAFLTTPVPLQLFTGLATLYWCALALPAPATLTLCAPPPRRLPWRTFDGPAVADAARRAALTAYTFDWGRIKAMRDAYVRKLNGIYSTNVDKAGVTYINGFAAFVGPRTIQVPPLM
jgi:hypothetical protein